MKPEVKCMQMRKPIFFVDDDSDDREIIADSLGRLRCSNAQFFQSGTDLLKHLDVLTFGEEPSLIVLDSQLPGPDGKTVLDYIQQNARFCRVPIMILTSYVNEKKKAALLASGACGVVEKPDSLAAYDYLIQDLISIASHG